MRNKSKLRSDIYPFGLPLDLETGEKWKPYPIVNGSTTGLNDFSCHASALAQGFSPHPPHEHDEEEILIILSGEVDIILKDSRLEGKPYKKRLQKNQFVYYPARFAHTLETVSKEPANYLMFKWCGIPFPVEKILNFNCFDTLSLQDTVKGQQGFSPQPVFEGATHYLKKLHCHTTILGPGAGYPPHADSYDVAILMLEGEVRTLDQHTKAPGVIFYEAGKPHGILNPASSPAKYLVFEFHKQPYQISRRILRMGTSFFKKALK